MARADFWRDHPGRGMRCQRSLRRRSTREGSEPPLEICDAGTLDDRSAGENAEETVVDLFCQPRVRCLPVNERSPLGP